MPRVPLVNPRGSARTLPAGYGGEARGLEFAAWATRGVELAKDSD